MKVVVFFFTLLTTAHANKPNILWIFSEDLSPYFGCYDCPINTGHTETIDQLAKDGVLFTRTYVPAPVCSACRSALITGLYQTSTGTHQHRSSRFTDGEVVPEDLRIHLPEDITPLPQLLKDAGYFTFNNGKDDYNFHYNRHHLYSTGTEENYQPGMNGWQGNKAIDFRNLNSHSWDSRPDKSQPWFGQITIWGGKANSKWVPKNERLADNDVPLPPYFPDVPAHRQSWTQHYNAARGASHRIQQILDKLEQDGEFDNTIIFFFSDHGNNQSLRHKQFCYEGGVHVPLIIRGNHPAIKADTIRKHLTNALDIPATTLALAGLDIPDYYFGQNLLAPDYQPADYVVSARDRCDYTIDRIRTVRTDEFRYIRNDFPERAMLQAQYRDDRPVVLTLKEEKEAGRLTEDQATHWFGPRPREEFYHLEKDPYQINNLATDPAFYDLLTQHRQILHQWQIETGDQGMQAEDPRQLKATFDLWKDLPIFSEAAVNPEYDQFR
ncbi:MAG: sulfatase [Verrucomicrobiota bacterium]